MLLSLIDKALVVCVLYGKMIVPKSAIIKTNITKHNLFAIFPQ